MKVDNTNNVLPGIKEYIQGYMDAINDVIHMLKTQFSGKRISPKDMAKFFEIYAREMRA